MALETRGVLLAGRYRVLRRLGSGGMASVFLCEDERLGRRVAVKRLHAPGAKGEADVGELERRFAREARLGASLSHPNLVTVFDTAADDESVLIVMEHVDGESLAQALRRGPLEPGRAATLVSEVAGALDHAHREGIVHRDVKPGNVLIRRDGVAKLVDLGIATAADSTRITSSGMLLGTAAYMAPEQLEARAAGPPADVYALAAVAFEALSGRKARPGATLVEVAHRALTEPPPDLRDEWPHAPAAAAEVLRRGMARDPGERPPTAGELARDLEHALEAGGERGRFAPVPIAARGGPPPAAGRSRSLRPALLAAALVLVVAVGAAALLLSGRGSGGSPERKARSAPAQQAQGTATQPERPAPVEPPAATGLGGAAEGARLNQQGFDLYRQGQYEQAIPVLERAVRAFPPGTDNLDYAYALYNLGASLRRAGRPRDAIPVLERRLQIPNQTAVVRAELEAARREARG
jgi:eukaryotic-like serine/threonine-protein kinase